MTSDPRPTEEAAAQTPEGGGGKQKRPVVWIVLAGVAVAAAIGLGVWAILLNDDLNDTEAQLEAQTAEADRPRPRPRVGSRMLVRASTTRFPASPGSSSSAMRT